MYADDRNDPDCRFALVMLNTHSSWCMYPVIQKQLTAAVNGRVTPGVAKEAFKTTIAAVFACDDQSHWRHDTESPEECDKITKKVSKYPQGLALV